MEKIKNYLKFSVLLIAISSIIYACQKEDIDNFDNSGQQKTNPYDISFSSFKEKTSIYNLNTFLKKKTNQNTNRENDELSFQDFIIDTSVVKQFALDDTRTSYSFKINLIENNVPDTTYNLFIRQLDNQWVSSIFMFVDDNDSSNDKRFSSIQEVYSYNGIYNPSASRGGSWEETTVYHCTNTGPCTSGVCDYCYLCVSYTTTYVSFTTYGEDPYDSGSGTIDGGMYNGGGGGAGSSNSPNVTVDKDCLPNINCRQGEIMDEDCECRIDLEDPCANKDLRNYVVATEVANMLESRQQPNTMVQSSELVDSFILETIDDGWGDINQDRFSIKIDVLPYGYTPFQLFNEIRMNLSNLVVGGNLAYVTDVTLEPYSDQDGITWVSDNPVGAAMDFDTILDTSTVYCVEYNEDEMYWVFATVTSYDHQGHFVAGVRQFGLEPNGSGGYSFYVRAADRLGGVLDYTFNALSGNDEILFTQAADATWKNLMENTTSLIQNQGGIVEEFDETKTYGSRHPYDEDDCQD